MAILNKEDFINSISFVTPSKAYARAVSKSDIYITLTGNKDSKSRQRLNLYFKNGVHQLIAESKRVKIGRFKNRLIFVEAENGYKCCDQNEEGTSAVVQITWNDSVNFIKPFINGEYELKYEDLYEYYYIEGDWNEKG